MKKTFAIFAAAVAAFALASCNKSLVEPEGTREETAKTTSEVIKLNITVGDFGGNESSTATKAVKKGWENGDQINIWFDTNCKQNPDLVIKYNGTEWKTDTEATVSGNSPAASGTLNAIYVEGGISVFTIYDKTGEDYAWFNPTRSANKYDGHNLAYAMPLTTCVEKASYTYSEETLTATLDAWSFSKVNNTQVVITGLPSTDYALCCDNMSPCYGIIFHNGGIDKCESAAGYYVLPVSNADGGAYMFRGYSGSDFTFTLCNADGTDKRTYSVSGKTLDRTDTKLNAIKIPFSKFSKVVDCVEIGGKKWAVMNVGATTAASSPATCYGDYFSWGEVKPYYSTINITSATSATFTWSSDTEGWGGTSTAKTGYTWANYCGNSAFTEWSTVPYDNNVLTSAHDAARANWGPAWSMATSDDFVALRNACTGGTSTDASSTTAISSSQNISTGGVYFLNAAGLTIDGVTYGVKGMLFVDANDTSLRVFFPAAGTSINTGLSYGNTECFYWASTLSDDSSKGRVLYYSNNKVSPYEKNLRYFGFSVRPVVAE